MHRGHQALVSRVAAKAPDYRPMAFTFRDNPKRKTRGVHAPLDLFSLRQRLEALEEAGIELCVLIDFSGNFSKLAGSEFVSILVESFGVRSFVVGSDFRCGYRHSTDAIALQAIAQASSAETEIVAPVTMDGAPVSSSRIRAAIADGRTDLALAMLGRPYTVDLRDAQFLYDTSFVSVSLRELGVAVPLAGRYEASARYGTERLAVLAELGGDEMLRLPLAAGSLGSRPDFLAFGPRVA